MGPPLKGASLSPPSYSKIALPVYSRARRSRSAGRFPFKLPYKWLCLFLGTALAVAAVILVAAAWHPSQYSPIEDIMLTPGPHDACAKTDARNFAEAFGDYAAVPTELGRTLELGCASVGITDVLLSLQRRTVDNVTVVSMSCDGDCPRVNSHTAQPLDDFFGSTRSYPVHAAALHQIGGEHAGKFDTVTGIHVMDRAENPYRLMWAMYQGLAPGGTLVLYDRVYTGDIAVVDRLRHGMRSIKQPSAASTPSAVTPAIMDRFIAHFDVVFHHEMLEYADVHGHLYRDIAIVARKPMTALAMPASNHAEEEGAAEEHQANTGYVSGASEEQHAEEAPVLIEDKYLTTGPAASRYFLIWTTGKETFDKLRFTVLDRLFLTVPGAEVFVYANKLPEDMFESYTSTGKNVKLVRYSETALFDGTPLARWAVNMDEWKRGQYLYSHFTDAFRLCVLWKYGGVYIDFDVLVLRDLGALRNSFGVEDEYGVDPLQPWWSSVLPARPSMNFAIANFDRGSAFLNYLMLQFHKVYDPAVWETVGPELVTQGMQDWRNFHPDLVLEFDDAVEGPRRARRFESTITIWTDPGVFYPVGWRSAVQSSSEAAFDADTMQIIRDRSFTFHVYTQMFKFQGLPFSFERGSLLDHVVKEDFTASH